MQEVTAIILRTYKIRETDRLCVALTREIGKIRGVIRRPLKQGLQHSASAEPFSEVRLQVYGREGQPLASFKPIELITSAFNRASDPEMLAFLSYAAELIDAFVPEGEPAPVHYRLIKALIASAVPDRIDDLRTYLVIWILKLAGLLPNLKYCSKCNRPIGNDVWLAADGSPLCQSCGGAYGDYISKEVFEGWSKILSHPPERLPQLEPAVNQILSPITNRLIRRALEREPYTLKAFSSYTIEPRKD